MKEQILKLRSEGKSYRQIQEELGCSSGTIAYHCGKGQKEKVRDKQIELKKTVKYKVYSKIDGFLSRNTNRNRLYLKRTEAIINYYNQIINNPYCYLTGEKIDLLDNSAYQLDHIIPHSKGGSNSLENMGLTTKNANQAKSDMTKDELIDLCKKILIHNGYTISSAISEVDYSTWTGEDGIA